MVISLTRYKAIANLNEKLLDLMNDKGMLSQIFLTPSSSVLNPETLANLS